MYLTPRLVHASSTCGVEPAISRPRIDFPVSQHLQIHLQFNRSGGADYIGSVRVYN